MIFTLICSLNPYCSGQWSHTLSPRFIRLEAYMVLILIVVDNGLIRDIETLTNYGNAVLILVVVEDGLVHMRLRNSMSIDNLS